MLLLPLHLRVSSSLRKKSYCSCQNGCPQARRVLTLGKASHDGADTGEGWLSDSANLLEQWLVSPLCHCWMAWWSGGWCGPPGTRTDMPSSRHRCSCVWSVWWRCSPQETHGWRTEEKTRSCYWSQGCRCAKGLHSIRWVASTFISYLCTYIALTSETIYSLSGFVWLFIFGKHYRFQISVYCTRLHKAA